MPKYGQGKYKTFKYGRYTAVKPAIGKIVVYRLSSRRSMKIVSKFKSLDGTRTDIVRMKCDNGSWVEARSTALYGYTRQIRIRSVNNSGTSQWVVAQIAILEELER